MNQAPMTASSPRQPTTVTVVDSEPELGALLGALDDAGCRTILDATSDEALSASELSEACDLPLSTTYRKLEKLTDADLVTERIRIRRSGKHVSEYARGVGDIVVSLGADGVEARLTREEPEAQRVSFAGLAD